jgi:SAM-dependent methyltransferase
MTCWLARAIGGFEHPAKLPHAGRLIRCDRITQQEAQKLFPEVDATRLPSVDVRLDLDTEGLSQFSDGSLDFVVCCHVLEHLKNPIQAIREFFRVLKTGGLAALAVPDKHFTFDVNRPLTAWEPLEDFFSRQINTTVAQDYFDIAKYIHPSLLTLPEAELENQLTFFMNRREHLNIWDSRTFPEFLQKALSLLQINHKRLYECSAEQNSFEYFVVVEKA